MTAAVLAQAPVAVWCFAHPAATLMLGILAYCGFVATFTRKL